MEEQAMFERYICIRQIGAILIVQTYLDSELPIQCFTLGNVITAFDLIQTTASVIVVSNGRKDATRNAC